jgi:hypothetical protein
VDVVLAEVVGDKTFAGPYTMPIQPDYRYMTKEDRT